MKIRTLFLTLFCAISISVSGQVDSFQENIIDYLNNNGTKAQYSDAYDQMFDVLKNQFSTADVPASVWAELKNNKAESIAEIVNFLTFAYRKHFTEAEIKKMATFYKSEAAQRMVSRSPETTQEDNDKVTAFFDSELGRKIEGKRAELSVDISEISGHWSRELFAAKMGDLIKQGYSPQQ